MNAEIEIGLILEVSNSLSIKEDYTVLYNGIPVGTAKNNLTWFPSNPRKLRHDEIKKVVYLGDYAWGVKQLTSTIDEFESFGQTLKDQILCNFLEMQKEFNELQKQCFFPD
jgi:hypothetical protein